MISQSSYGITIMILPWCYDIVHMRLQVPAWDSRYLHETPRYLHETPGTCMRLQVPAWDSRYLHETPGTCMRLQVPAWDSRYLHEPPGTCMRLQVPASFKSRTCQVTEWLSANTTCSTTLGLMLAQRLRRWTNNKATAGSNIFLYGLQHVYPNGRCHTIMEVIISYHFHTVVYYQVLVYIVTENKNKDF